ncbi:MAG: B12-binding domain-containing radical SAM protein [Elusimicrobia bacterium]|nr:B12-binding domain-containing radical SAM protein [Elusimicrobiota bacterium]
MAKILIVNPVIRAEDNPKHVAYGLALCAALADKAGHQVMVFDANGHRPGDDVLREALSADSWDIIATGGITTSYGYIKKTVKLARECSPKSLIVLGGGFLTSMPLDIMTFLPEADLGVVGEAFVTWPELLERFDGGKPDWASCLGLIYRDENRQIRLNASRPLIPNLDVLPYPAWEMFPLDIYFKNSGLLLSEEAMTAKRRLDINTSYGCSLICRFCFHLGLTGDMKVVEDAQGRRDVEFSYDRQIRWHSPRYIVDMVKYMRTRFGVDFVTFLDENLMTMNATTRGKWLSEICRLWKEEGLQPDCVRRGAPHDPDACRGVHWSGTSHAGLCSPGVLKMMHEAGCTYLDYGLESFSARVLRNIGKGATPENNIKAVKITMEAGIRPIPNQIMGFPDEFFDSIVDSIRAWQTLGIKANPFFATPYPGSEWYYTYKDKILEQYGGDLEAFLLDLGDATKITAVISENFNAVELLGLRELMVQGDLKRVQDYEKVWRKSHGEPNIPDFRKQGRRSFGNLKGPTRAPAGVS